jgi:hypothetical protein
MGQLTKSYLEEKFSFKNGKFARCVVAHTYNPSYLGSRDQKDCCSKPGWENSSQDPVLKIPNIKQG